MFERDLEEAKTIARQIPGIYISPGIRKLELLSQLPTKKGPQNL